MALGRFSSPLTLVSTTSKASQNDPKGDVDWHKATQNDPKLAKTAQKPKLTQNDPKTEVDKFSSRRPIGDERKVTQNKRARPIEKQLVTFRFASYYLNST